jgi:diphosphomevalonate decarboxylase
MTVMQAVREARAKGLTACYTIDAGPNVHVIAEAASAEKVAGLLSDIPGVREVRASRVGGPAHLVEEN